MGIDDAASHDMRDAILSGDEIHKLGFVRLNFSYLASDDEVDAILQAVLDLADHTAQYVVQYTCDPMTAIFTPNG